MKYQILTLTSLLLIGCGGSSTGSSSNSSIKTYNATVTPNSDLAYRCGSASGDIVINGSNVSGTVKLNNSNLIYVVSGTYIKDTGGVEGGFAVSGRSVAEFSGVVRGSTGGGTYSDDYNCRGTWSVREK